MSAKQLATTLTEAGLELPAPIQAFLEGRAVPLALDTRARVREWSRARGFSAKQHDILTRLIHRIVSHDRYRKAVASGELHRIDLDGQDAGPVSEAERENAAKSLATTTAMRKARKAVKPVKADTPETDSTPTTRTDPSSSPASSPSTSSISPPSPAAVDRVREGIALASRAAATQDIVTVASVFRRNTESPRVVAVEKRPVRAFKKPPAALASRPGEAADNGAPRPQAKPYVPAPHVRRTVEDVAGRRNSVRLIVAHHKAGHEAAASAERAAWEAEAVNSIVADGYARDIAVAQVRALVDDMLLLALPRQARR